VDFFEEEIVRFLNCLNKNKVTNIFVDDFAVSLNGFNRSIKDLDLWLADTTENRKPFVAALIKYGVEGAELFHKFPSTVGYAEIILDNGLAVDVMVDWQFFKQDKFIECYNLASEFNKAKNTNVKVLQINTLIEEKERSNRAKDNLDAQELKKLY